MGKRSRFKRSRTSSGLRSSREGRGFLSGDQNPNGRKMVGAVRFELTTSCTRNKRATRLRYAPTEGAKRSRSAHRIAIKIFPRGERRLRTLNFAPQTLNLCP